MISHLTYYLGLELLSAVCFGLIVIVIDLHLNRRIKQEKERNALLKKRLREQKTFTAIASRDRD